MQVGSENTSMALRPVSFAEGEWYHCYSRGVEKKNTFSTPKDYARFIETMYLTNSVKSAHRSDFYLRSHGDILSTKLDKPLVSIGAWCLMPNHFHILLKETKRGGISKYMQKLGTAYTMYFNKKNSHIGGVFVKPFRAKHISDDQYLRKVSEYIHMNPADIVSPGWRDGGSGNKKHLVSKLLDYPYSSLLDYETRQRPEASLLSQDARELIGTSHKGIEKVVDDAVEYFRELGI